VRKSTKILLKWGLNNSFVFRFRGCFESEFYFSPKVFDNPGLMGNTGRDGTSNHRNFFLLELSVGGWSSLANTR
jgi:hypothetical protein